MRSSQRVLITPELSKPRGRSARRAPLRQRLLELYADCAGYPVDSVIRDAAALMYGEPSG
jgi:hypothetical protein